MPSVSFSVPKYRHHKGSGQAFVQVKGKRHYLGPYGSPTSKERYSQFVAELAVRPAAASTVVTKDKPVVTVVELCAAYLDFAETYYRKNGQVTGTVFLITRATTLLSEIYGRTTAADFGPLALMAVQQSLASKGLSRR